MPATTDTAVSPSNAIQGVRLHWQGGVTLSREIVAQLEGIPLYGEDTPPTQRRSYRTKMGSVRGVRQDGSGVLRGNLVLNPGHPDASQLLWDAENAPQSVAVKVVKDKASRKGFAAIMYVVTDEAPGAGLFESRDTADAGPSRLEQLQAELASLERKIGSAVGQHAVAHHQTMILPRNRSAAMEDWRRSHR